MFVFYGSTGAVTFTANGGRDLTLGRADWIEVPAQDLGDLTAWNVIGGALVQVSLEPAKRDARTAINATVGEKRQTYLTPLPGQEMVYLRKEEEARRYLAQAAPDMADFPMLAAEVGITAPTAYQLAQVWLYMSASWVGIAAALEAMRMAAAAKVDTAATPGAIDAAVEECRKAVAGLRS